MAKAIAKPAAAKAAPKPATKAAAPPQPAAAARPKHVADPIDVLVGARVRVVRKQQGLSQTKLADALNLTFQQIQKYERGSNRVSASMLVHIADFLGVSAGSLLGEDEPAGSALLTPHLGGLALTGAVQLLNDYGRLEPGLRKAVASFVHTIAKAGMDPADPASWGEPHG
jgi:transcriptional regulator with XRE-family HTH domain